MKVAVLCELGNYSVFSNMAFIYFKSYMDNPGKTKNNKGA